MKSHTLKFKQDNMLCDKCLLNVVKSLSTLPNLEEISVSLETRRIKLTYNDSTISKEEMKNIVNQSILTGKTIGLGYTI